MERSEPTLVPEWLRSTGSVTGGGNSAHHFASSSLHSDALSSAHSTRNRSSRTLIDKDTPRSAFLDQSSSSNSRRSSSSNGSTKHPYSSFTRIHRDKNRDKEKERSVIRDLCDHDSSDPLGNILISRCEKDTLRRSRSMVSRKPSEVLPRRAADSKNGGSNNHNSSNGVLSGGSVSCIQKAAFEKDFPSLGTEEKPRVPDIGRVSSPILSTAVQSLPIGISGLIGGEGWTSALAEVPTIIGSNNMGTSSVQQSSVSSALSGASGAMAGLNMAEALSQAPSRARTNLQLPDKTQRLEELAIKQSRQLIPMTPSMPKALVFNSSEKSKPKTAARTSEMVVAAKSIQQQPHSSQLANQSLRGGQVRPDGPRTSHTGKFLVLKPVWENGVSSTAKDVSSPTNASRVANSQLAVAPSAPVRTPNTPKLSTVERKAAALALNPIGTVEKRPSLSQAQSRSDFFNLMRKKTSMNTSIILPDSDAADLSPTVEKSGEVIKEVSAPVRPCETENGSKVTINGDTHEEIQTFDVGEKHSCLNGTVYPDEEEAAFLRSLGWEENAGEDEALTEEEINAFVQECKKLRPSLKLCRGVQPKLSMLSESHVTSSSRASSELSSSESGSEA
uniref:Putative cell wall protein AWA1 n=1 Tax=Davidia involucrata TaxID=16924 RepID=A0A5B6ZMJ3_DAVIN